MKTSRAACAIYSGQNLLIFGAGDSMIVKDEAGMLLDTSLFDLAENLIAARIEALTVDKENEKVADRNTVAATFGATLAEKLLPDSLYQIAYPLTMSMNGTYIVGTIHDAQLAKSIKNLFDNRGRGNGN